MKQRELRAALQNAWFRVSTSGMLKCSRNSTLMTAALQVPSLKSESTMPKLISRYFCSYSIPCRRYNCICKLDIISFINIGQVVMAFEVFFENRERVFDRIVVRGIGREKFEFYICIFDHCFQILQ